jgi:hypothetical protein
LDIFVNSGAASAKAEGLSVFSAGAQNEMPRCCLFQVPRENGQAMSRPECEEKMEVVGHTADSTGNGTQSAHGSAKVVMNSISPFAGDLGFAAVRTKNQV